MLSACGFTFILEMQGLGFDEAVLFGGHDAVVELLVAAGADANAAATAGYGGRTERRTVLQAAAEGGHLEIVEKLLAAEADANAAAGAGNYKRTALQAAAGGGYLEVVEKLLTTGADVNAGLWISLTVHCPDCCRGCAIT
ncbi:hypothetical protein B0J13DRAFT_236433 [Dactylonectria estremocensis]|uniref:Uncharacterized protein n=1 Tax=Dactylonectria estremocensis TaxID=1079267 RepID=A0A9P9IB62_9HYPO|nr:hypothetical protein B0J13DRAFT_236433 [Dactylonectria estremocensis]